MRNVSRLNIAEKPSFEEIVQLETRGRELRSEEFRRLLASAFGKAERFIKKALHADVHGKLHNNARA